MPKQDSRESLNLALKIYYHSPVATTLYKGFEEHGLPCNHIIAKGIDNTLERDGHITVVGKGHSMTPPGMITGQGRVFYESGGYKDNTSRFDKAMFWMKNHKVISWILFGTVGISSVIGFVKIVREVIGWIK